MKGRSASYRVFVAMCVSLVTALLFSTFHSFFYNWAFLPRFFNEHQQRALINGEMLIAYLKWTPGLIMSAINVIALIIPIVLFVFLRKMPVVSTENQIR